MMTISFRMIAIAAALGMLSGLATAQEQGATAGSEPIAATTTAAHVDNGAMPGDSHVRIVRLSDVKGNIALDRKTGLGFEQTMPRSEEHTSELQSRFDLVCRLLLEKKKQ